MAILLVGASSTSIRLADELVRGGEHVFALVLESSADWMLDELRHVGATVRPVASIRDDELRAAGVARVQAVVVLGLDEMTTVRIALMVEELNPGARIVLELDNPAFGRRLEPLVGSCTALSAAELAAPAFVAAAFSGGLAQPVTIGGRRLAAGRDSRVGGDVVAVLGDVRSDEVNLTLPERGNVVLGSRVVSSGPRARQSGLWGAFVSLFDRRLRYVIAGLLALGRSPETVVSVGRRVVILAEVEVRRRVPIAALQVAGESRVLALRREGGWAWHPRSTELLQPGDRIAVAATRGGMAATSLAVGE